jgi:osmotically-inducible protein OsmY
VATTAQIRKEIIAEKTMSVNAQNVKIITIDGQVTLRGPVNTAEEKRLIGEIADRSTHSGDVDNQLEVQPTPVSDK